MPWRSIIINNPAKLSYKHKALVVTQGDTIATVPLDDIAVIVIGNPQITLTSPLVSACADNQIAIISVDRTHTPNGLFLPLTPHSRALKIMHQQLAMTLPFKKKL